MVCICPLHLDMRFTTIQFTSAKYGLHMPSAFRYEVYNCIQLTSAKYGLHMPCAYRYEVSSCIQLTAAKHGLHLSSVCVCVYI